MYLRKLLISSGDLKILCAIDTCSFYLQYVLESAQSKELSFVFVFKLLYTVFFGV